MTADALGFTARLHTVMDAIGQPYRGRQTWLMRRLKDEGLVVSQAGVHKWFSGQSTPDLAHLLLISKVLRVQIEWLAFGTGPMRSDELYGSTEIASVVGLMENMTPTQQRQLKRIAETAFEQTDLDSKSA